MTDDRTWTGAPDLLIVGSGPAGASVARAVADAVPGARIRMVEVGPAPDEQVGRNARNVPSGLRDAVRRASQGPFPDSASVSRIPTDRRVEGTITARQGTHLLEQPEGFTDMPAAAMSSVVGGQGIHWTGATPEPLDSEVTPLLDPNAWASLLDRSRALLRVSAEPYPTSLPERAVRRAVAGVFDGRLAAGRAVSPLPAACSVHEDGSRHWTGVDTILGGLAGETDRFVISPETLCRRLVVEGGQVVAVELESRVEGGVEIVRPRAVVVAADALRTPQLLWASGIRPAALGRYLTEHPLVFGVVALSPDAVRTAVDADPEAAALPPLSWTEDEPIGAMLRVPFSEPTLPFAGQLMVLGRAPMPVSGPLAAAPAYVLVGFGCRQQPDPQNRLVFSDTETDSFGMPKIGIRYRLGEQDLAELERAKAAQAEAAGALGPFLPGGEPKVMPAGSSLHYQGTVRMGAADDGTSVCDVHGSVWGTANLYVAGNGVIATATACNPTLTSVAFALGTADRVAERLTAPVAAGSTS
jgi:choline dehydrogenase-like flavoprotein